MIRSRLGREERVKSGQRSFYPSACGVHLQPAPLSPPQFLPRSVGSIEGSFDNATHQRRETHRVANREDTTSLPMLEGTECPACGQLLPRRLGALDGVDLPAGVRFDPSDEELLRHLAAKLGRGNETPHPLIDDFIAHLDGDEGICQTHPRKLPGVKEDGSSRHFFHKPAKAYTTGNRKRRKINNEDETSGVETRWHKTGKTRPVNDDGRLLGWKKIMVLYENSYSGKKKAKSEKTNWILHQYHLGPDEEERDGELVVCKVFYQKQPRQCTGGRQAEIAIADDADCPKPETSQVPKRAGMEISTGCASDASRGTLITPKRDAPHRPQFSRRSSAETSPVSQVHLQSSAVRTPTQSGWGSDMTVMGLPEFPPSEMTSSLGFPNRPPDNVGSGLSERIHYVPVEIHRENEELSSREPREDGNAVLAVEGVSRGDEYGLERNAAGIPQASEIDDGLLSAPELCCTEELGDMSFLSELGSQSFEYEGFFSEGHQYEDVFPNPYPDYPDYDGMLMSSPPYISLEMKMSSQEAQDVSEMWKYSDVDPNDNNDSQSST
ncbi:hypothetical protein R1sor_000217 [Riccia sorocarpa]|uniref:NAC domain-containing protein n=1 Tax=Riccia sorocarpa TaxID=122646 RepID=A0ABD3GVQ2_9MARC